MRPFGVLESTVGSGLSDHICWLYDDRDAFVETAVEFLRLGLALGQRALYVGDRTGDELAADLAPLGDVAAMVAAGRLLVCTLPSMYEAVAQHGNDAQTALYEDLTRAAVRDGFSGLRVAADATAAVRDPASADDFIRYEHVVNRLAAERLPFAAMCGYDSTEITVDVGCDLVAVHPLANATDVPFAVFGIDEASLAIVGETDALCVDMFERTLSVLLPAYATTGQAIDVDCSGLDFIDHTSLLALDRAVAYAGLVARLVGGPTTIARIGVLVPLPALRIEVER